MLNYSSKFKFEINKVKNKNNVFSNNHYHPYYELLYVKKGSFSYFIDSKVYNISDNSVVLVSKDLIHKASFAKNCDNSYYLINFFEDFLDKSMLPIIHKLFESRTISLDEINDFEIHNIFHTINKEYNHPSKYSELYIKHLLSELIIKLFRIFGDSKPSYTMSPIEKSALYIGKCLKEGKFEELNLKNVSRKFFTSPTYFSKKFKKELGIGFKEYVLSAKVIYSKKLIETTNLPITQIALQSGFEDSNYFSTAFKRVENISPREYAAIVRNVS